EVEPRRIDQVGAMQRLRHEPDQEAEILLELWLALEAKVSFETHAARQEGEEADAHADRCRAQRGNAELGAARVHLAADVEHEIVEAVHEHIDALEKGVDVAVVDALVEAPDLHLRVD